MTSELVCTKCSGQMQEGLIVDMGYQGTIQSIWVEDRVESSTLAGGKTGGKWKVKIRTSRCSDCGHLDSYAR